MKYSKQFLHEVVQFLHEVVQFLHEVVQYINRNIKYIQVTAINAQLKSGNRPNPKIADVQSYTQACK